MRIPFTLISDSGDPMLGKSSQATVELSKDGAAFTPATGEVKETGYGCYYIDLTSSECSCSYYVTIRITITGGQTTILQYTPDEDPGDIADAVWENGHRTLTSLNVDKQATEFIQRHPCPPPPGHCRHPLHKIGRW